MKNNLTRWMPVVAVALCTGLFVSSCSDDDEDVNENISEQRHPDSADNISGTLEEEILRHLVYLWCDVDKDVLQGQWAIDTYEPTIGFVTDPSRPYVRSIQVDSLAGADRYAVDCFLPLGIDFEHPDGFTYSKPEVGTVSYQHSSEPNTLGVITLSGVRQLPHLQQIRLVKQLPENAGGIPYYKPGTIVEYKGCLWICANYHDRGEKAKFVTFTSPADLTIGTFNWYGVGKDSVYTDEMADASTLIDWVQNILLNDNYYLGDQNVNPAITGILDILTEAGETNRIRQIVPQSQAVRFDLANELFNPNKIIADVHGHTPKRVEDYIWEDNVNAIDDYNNEHHLRGDNSLKYTYRVAPRGYMLCNKMRYAIGSITNTSWHQWVPYVLFCNFAGFGQIFEVMGDAASQNKLDPEHFQWSYRIEWHYENLSWQSDYLETIQKYYAVKAAFYWQHEYSYVGGDPNPAVWEQDKGEPSYILMHYTKDWKEHPSLRTRDFYLRTPDYWTSRNITSREMAFVDNGVENMSYRTVYRVP